MPDPREVLRKRLAVWMAVRKLRVIMKRILD